MRRWGLVAILAFAFALRLYRLGAESLWYDETVSVYLAGQSLPALVAHTAGDIHPPGYYLLLHAWTRLAGSSDFAVALPSLFFGLLLVALAFRLGARLFGPGVGLLAAFLVALSPFTLWYSQEVRMYTLGAALGMGLLLVVVALLWPARERRGGDWPLLLAYAVLGALGLWVLYYFAFLLVAINLMVGLWWLAHLFDRPLRWAQDRLRAGSSGGRWLGRWAVAQLAVLALYAPWIPIAWRQATNPPVPPWRSFTGLGDLLLQTWSALSLGQSVDPARVWPVLLLFAGLFALALFVRRRRERAPACLLAGYVFLPVLLIYLASLLTPLFHVRYAFTYSTPFYVVLAAGLAWLWHPFGKLRAGSLNEPLRQAQGRLRAGSSLGLRAGMWLALAVIVAFSGVSIHAYHTDVRYAADDHRAAVRFVADRWRPGDAILVDAGYAYTALLAYWDGDPIAWRGRLVGDPGGSPPYEQVDAGPLVLQAGTVDGDPSLGWGDPRSDFYAMSRADAAGALDRLFAHADRVWLYRIYDTVTDPGGFIRDWLDAHGTRFEDRVYTGESQLRVQGYLGHRPPPPGVQRAVESGSSLTFGDGSLHLLGTPSLQAGAETEVEVGGALDLAAYWQRTGRVPGDLILFAGLDDPPFGAVAQVDERPAGPLFPVGAWPAGEVVRTPLRIPIPAGTPPGRYSLVLGWYHFVGGQPVWLAHEQGDRLIWGEVQVVAPADWAALPSPGVTYDAGVTLGGVEFLGFDAPSLAAEAGQTLRLDLYWRALHDGPEQGAAVLQLAGDGGRVYAVSASAPAGGRAPFPGLAAGQVVRDSWLFSLPPDLEPGVYDLSLGRRPPDGPWLPVRRGPLGLGTTYPLATVRVLPGAGPELASAPPSGVEHVLDARLGEGIRLAGYDLDRAPAGLGLTLHWQALVPMEVSYKVFVHLVGPGGPADIRAQADVYPRPPTAAWQPGDDVRQPVALALPAGLPAGDYDLLLGVYDEGTGDRLPVLDAQGGTVGDSLLLETIHVAD
jgi:hypothetical protein